MTRKTQCTRSVTGAIFILSAFSILIGSVNTLMVDSASAQLRRPRSSLGGNRINGPKRPSSDKQDQALLEKERQFKEKVLPVLEANCFDCHGNGAAEGDFSMAEYDSAMKLLDYRSTWLKVLQRIETGDMPPKDFGEMPKDERGELIGWLSDHLTNIDCGVVSNPGDVTIRRLTRYEYRNTIRDLTGVDYEPADDFPADDVGYGFDNIGDVLSLPPLLMEKYLKAAEEIANEAIDANAFVPPRTRKIMGMNLKRPNKGANVDGSGVLVLSTNGEASIELEFPHHGRYEFRVFASGNQAGDEPVQMTIKLDDRKLREVKVRAEPDQAVDFVTRSELRAGKRMLSLSFDNDYYDADFPDPSRRDRNLRIARIEIDGPLDFKPRNLADSHKMLVPNRPDEEVSFERACEEVLTPLLSRAFRRPATEDEINRFRGLIRMAIDEGDSFETGVQLAVQAALVSPHFLFKVEEPFVEGEPERELNEYELGTSLSYFLWSSMPDDELFYVSWSKKLRDQTELEKQIKRYLQDERSDAFIENFVSQWLQLRALDQFSPDPKLFPEFDDELRSAMQQESILFFRDIVRNDRSILELFDANYTFVNQRLAEHYGIPNIRGDEFQRIRLNTNQRGGVLTQASILTVTSNPSRTSPVKRGKWIIENLLGEPPPPPAPDIMGLEDQAELTGTLRERMQQHRENPSCASCHAKMDPLGFALENYDAIGRWRTDDEGAPIDSSGNLPTGEGFDGAAQLKHVLIENRREQLLRCFTEKLLTYALGRGLEYYDQCAVDLILAEAADDNYKVSAFVRAIVNSDPFQKRRERQGE